MAQRVSPTISRAEAEGTVYLIDDDPSVRRALTRLLRAAGFPAESFPTAQEFLANVGNRPGPGCVVSDLRMPGLSGLELQDELGRRGLDIPMVFISGRADVGSGVKAMKGGAVDFLQKPVNDGSLLQAVRSALDRDQQRRADRVERAELASRAARLTPREREVFALVAAGLLNKQVAAELGATEKTIKVHRARVMEKMQAASLAGLVRMADRLGLSRAALRQGPPESPVRP